MTDAATAPLIVGIGGSNREGSSTDRLLEYALAAADQLGARTVMFSGSLLGALPIYGTQEPTPDAAGGFAEVIEAAHGIIIATPGYHGGVSGLLKNALDHLEVLSDRPRPYLQDRAVGLIVTAAGWQACGTALVSLRSTVHALRGWPTPFGATYNSAESLFDAAGSVREHVIGGLELVAQQVVDFARWRRLPAVGLPDVLQDAAGAASPNSR